MNVVSIRSPVDFAQEVLRGIATIEPPAAGESDLRLELGLSLWMRRSGTDVEAARPAMLAMRAALVEASGIDLATEPFPLCGVDPRLDVLNLGTYLRRLMVRATTRTQCDASLLAERALERLRSGHFGFSRSGTLALG
jgi:hypothetical protein